MTRDTFDMFNQYDRDRGRFADKEYGSSAPNREYKSDLVDLTLLFHKDTGAAIGVSDPCSNKDKWIFLPKSQIEFELKPGGIVEVSMPGWLAREKGLS